MLRLFLIKFFRLNYGLLRAIIRRVTSRPSATVIRTRGKFDFLLGAYSTTVRSTRSTLGADQFRSLSSSPINSVHNQPSRNPEYYVRRPPTTRFAACYYAVLLVLHSLGLHVRSTRARADSINVATPRTRCQPFFV